MAEEIYDHCFQCVSDLRCKSADQSFFDKRFIGGKFH